MSVIVMGMEMPENCYDCPFVRASWGNDYYCAKGNGTEDNIRVLMSKRMDDCPLIEVSTPHGELVDRNGLMDIYADRLTAVAERYSPDSSEYGILSGAMKLLAIMPTVIEAED